MIQKTSFLLCLISSLLVFSACGPDMPPAGSFDSRSSMDNWFISGSVKTQGYDGGEVVAVSMDGFLHSSVLTQEQEFGFELPPNATYAIYFMPKKQGNKSGMSASSFIDTVRGPKKAKYQAAMLVFEDSPDMGMRNTLRLPQIIMNNELDLGEIDIKGNQAFPTKNPSMVLDFDNDGLNDLADQDDQNDGLSDKMQRDQLERIEICHLSGKKSGSTENVSLINLLDHMMHGDPMGPCKLTQDTDMATDDAPIMPEPEDNEDHKAPPPSHADSGRSNNGKHPIERTPKEGDEADEDNNEDDKKKNDKKKGGKKKDETGDDDADESDTEDDTKKDEKKGDDDKKSKD